MARQTQAEKRLQVLTKSWRKVLAVCPDGKKGQLTIVVTERDVRSSHVRSSHVRIVWHDPDREESVTVFQITVGVQYLGKDLTWKSDTDYVFRHTPRHFWVAEEMYRLARRFHQLYVLRRSASGPL